jgi:hypothetical protein
VDGFPFPLNIDAYYVFLVLHPNTLVYPSLGILDASGRATAEIALPPLDPGLIGVTLHHAFLTFDFSAGPVVDFASNAAPLRLTTEADFVPEDFEGAALGWQFGGGELPFTTWKIVEDGVCGAVTRMAALTTNPPACGAGLQTAILNARLSSSPFRLGEVADYELRFDSILTAGIDVRVRLFVGGSPAAYFEVASTTDFDANGVLESLAFHVPGVEYAVGSEARVEFLLTGFLTGSPSGWWVGDVELVKLP